MYLTIEKTKKCYPANFLMRDGADDLPLFRFQYPASSRNGNCTDGASLFLQTLIIKKGRFHGLFPIKAGCPPPPLPSPAALNLRG